jgi:hypothetical protein
MTGVVYPWLVKKNDLLLLTGHFIARQCKYMI